MRRWIVDGARVVCLRDPVAGSTSTTDILIEHPALAEFLGYSFETLWANAETLARTSRTVRNRVTRPRVGPGGYTARKTD
jgi:hypothetical protein